MKKGPYSLSGKATFDWEIVRGGHVYGLIPKEFDDDARGNLAKTSNRKEAQREVDRMNAAYAKRMIKLRKDTEKFTRHIIVDLFKYKPNAAVMRKINDKIFKDIAKVW